ncbi:MAG TPA: M48 family metalloprotease [Candidatus Polarisedimenticolaceae bacterium]
MTEKEFTTLVLANEARANRNPSLYKLRVAGMAAGAYAYLLGMIVVLLAAAVAVCWAAAAGHAGGLIKLLFPIGFVLWIVLRAMWVRMDPPDGLVVTERDAPELFSMIEEARRAVGAPRPDVVRIDGQLNASISQIPRLGFLGWHRNHLTLGLPLMRLLTPDEFRSVVAHEFGHLSKAHGAIGAWIYRLRATWGRIVEDLEKEGRGDWLVSGFFKRFNPRFAAASFVLARQHEYEADRLAAQAAGAPAAASALARLDVAARFVEGGYWPALFHAVTLRPDPPERPFDGLGGAVPYERTEVLKEALDAALEVRTGVADTHPSLADRLRALGAKPAVPQSPATTADVAYLGSALPSIEAALSRTWLEAVEPRWRERHRLHRESEEELAALEANREPSTDEAFRRAQLTEELRGLEAAIPRYEEVHAMNGALAGPLGALARHRLSQGDESGIALLERALESDPDSTPFVSRLVYDFLRARERRDEAAAWRKRGELYEAKLEAARAERETLRKDDPLEPHGLETAVVDALLDQLRDRKGLGKAWLVRKRMEHFPDRRKWILVVSGAGWLRTDKRIVTLVSEIAQDVGFPGDTMIVGLTSGNGFLKGMVQKVEGARIL